MTKSSEETEIPAPRRQKDEQTKSWLHRMAGSVWHYVLTLVFVVFIAVGIWLRPNFAAETMNLVAIFGLASAGLAMCFAMTKISKNQRLALMTAVIYLAAPCLLENFYARMSLVDGVTMIALPILILGLYQMTAHKKHAVRYLAIAATMMIFTNGVLAIMLLAMAVIYALLNVEKMLNFGVIWRIILATIVTLGLTAGFIVPFAETWLNESESFSQEYVAEYAGMMEMSGAEMNERRVRPRALIDFDYAAGGYGVALGVMALVGVVGFWFAWRTFEDKAERRFVTTLYIIGVAAVILATPVVNWKKMPNAVYVIQNPGKMLVIAAAMLSVVASYTIFALVRRMTAVKQAIFAVIMSALAVFSVAQIIMSRNESYAEAVQVANETLMSVGVWINERVQIVSEVMARGYVDLRPTEIATLVSVVTAGLGVIWVIISGVRDLLRRRKQRQVDSLIDSVWEAMAETERKKEETGAKKKTKRTQAEKPKEKLLPEPPEPEVPGLNLGNKVAGVNSDTMMIPTETKPAKKNARKKKSTKKAEAKPKADDKEKVAVKKTTRTTVRSTTTKMKHIKAEPETPEKNEETEPRVTKVKARTKKEA